MPRDPLNDIIFIGRPTVFLLLNVPPMPPPVAPNAQNKRFYLRNLPENLQDVTVKLGGKDRLDLEVFDAAGWRVSCERIMHQVSMRAPHNTLVIEIKFTDFYDLISDLDMDSWDHFLTTAVEVYSDPFLNLHETLAELALIVGESPKEEA